jgi:hypothetical protein
MTAEKLNRMEEMERLLRRVIALNPEHPHAYNALGYSCRSPHPSLGSAGADPQGACPEPG